MHKDIAELIIDTRVDDGGPIGLEVYGEPLHCTAEELITRFKGMKLQAFFAQELRRSVGNYVLVQRRPGSIRVVTSVGYCGGYVNVDSEGHTTISTLFSEALRPNASEIRMNAFGLNFYLSRAPHSSFNLLPLQTIFEGVKRLPSATVVDIVNGKLTRFHSYLYFGNEQDVPVSFEQALNEVIEVYANNIERAGLPASVMFSGGVDSLIVLLKLRERLGDDLVRAVTVAHNTANGPDRAEPIAEKLGFELTKFPSVSELPEEFYSQMTAMMRHDIVATRSPHHAFFGHPTGKFVLHGQNMDAMMSINMTVMQANLEVPYLAASKRKHIGTPAERDQHATFLKNLMFTDDFRFDDAFFASSKAYYAKLVGGVKPDTENSVLSIARGMISSQHPGLITPIKSPIDFDGLLSGEARASIDFLSKAAPSDPNWVFLLRYLTYSQLSAKRLTTFNLSHGAEMGLVAMAGPIVSYCLHKKRSLMDAASPKGEIYDLAEKLAGEPYSKLIGVAPRTGSRAALSEVDRLLEMNVAQLVLKHSKIVERVDDPGLKADVIEFYDRACSSWKIGSQGYTLLQQSRARNILNMELIMDEALGEAIRPIPEDDLKAAYPIIVFTPPPPGVADNSNPKPAPVSTLTKKKPVNGSIGKKKKKKGKGYSRRKRIISFAMKTARFLGLVPPKA